jgi:hypothetical protein
METNTSSLSPKIVRIIKSRWLYILLACIFLASSLWFQPSAMMSVLSEARMAKGFWDNVGIVSAVAGGFALALWLTRMIWMKYKKQPQAASSLVQIGVQIINWLRAQHLFFGWIVFGLGLFHAIYFLVFPRGQILNFYTGLLAVTVMFFVVGLGIMFHYKTISLKSARSWHMYAGLAFAVALAAHILL